MATWSRFVRRFGTGAALIAITGWPLGAQVVYDGGSPNGGAGWILFNGTRSADDFRVIAPVTFSTIRFWALLPSGISYAPQIFWQIAGDESGLPGTSSVAKGTSAAVGIVRGASAHLGFDSWQFEIAAGPQSLGSGLYWLALHDGMLSDATFSDLVWETTDQGHGTEFAVEDLGMWTGGWPGNLAFQLIDSTTVPEPTTLGLFATGLVAFAAGLRRRVVSRAGGLAVGVMASTAACADRPRDTFEPEAIPPIVLSSADRMSLTAVLDDAALRLAPAVQSASDGAALRDDLREISAALRSDDRSRVAGAVRRASERIDALGRTELADLQPDLAALRLTIQSVVSVALETPPAR